jgi:hypothetical protein
MTEPLEDCKLYLLCKAEIEQLLALSFLINSYWYKDMETIPSIGR